MVIGQNRSHSRSDHVFVPAGIFISARDEGEFAGTLAHAIGHAALRHETRTANRGQLANMASILVPGIHAAGPPLILGRVDWFAR